MQKKLIEITEGLSRYLAELEECVDMNSLNGYYILVTVVR